MNTKELTLYTCASGRVTLYSCRAVFTTTERSWWYSYADERVHTYQLNKVNKILTAYTVTSITSKIMGSTISSRLTLAYCKIEIKIKFVSNFPGIESMLNNYKYTLYLLHKLVGDLVLGSLD